jgi:uncharacterized protein (DUF1499 family)
MNAQSRGKAAIPWVARSGCTLATAGFVMELIAGPGFRSGWWGLGVALIYLFALGGILAILGCGVSIVGAVLGRRFRTSGVVAGATGAVLGLVPALLFYQQAHAARSSPSINDVSTDLQDPPAFVAAAGNAFWAGKSMAYPPGVADSVRRSYPDLGPLVLADSPARTFALVRATATAQPDWVITAADSEAGRLEATATTRWFGFTDDLVIRLRGRGLDTTVVDMRSKSRVGKGDVGVNAARIRRYFTTLKRAAGP